MSKITSANVNASNSTSVSFLNANGTTISDSITVGSVIVNSTALTVGNSVVNSSTIAADSLVLGGTAYYGQILAGAIINTQIFTANGTWTNPYCDACNPVKVSMCGNEQVLVMMWGGGGATCSGCGGGGGGACAIGLFKITNLTNTTVTVANNTQFSNFNKLYAYSGASYSCIDGGGGGGLFSGGITTTGGGPLGGAGGNPGGASTFGGGGGGNCTGYNGGVSIFGGGGGGGRCGNGGSSVFGGGGAACCGVPSNFDGTSVFGGSAYYIPGGGGSKRGEVRVWVIK